MFVSDGAVKNFKNFHIGVSHP